MGAPAQKSLVMHLARGCSARCEPFRTAIFLRCSKNLPRDVTRAERFGSGVSGKAAVQITLFFCFQRLIPLWHIRRRYVCANRSPAQRGSLKRERQTHWHAFAEEDQFQDDPRNPGRELDWRCKRGPRGRNWPASAPAMTWASTRKSGGHSGARAASASKRSVPPESRGTPACRCARIRTGLTTEIGERAAPHRHDAPAQALEPTERAAGPAGRQFRKEQESGEIS